jgi:sterol desaturase/sphingolipid hydroxylase (fatty acid hydroxylase superfamily)
MPVEYNLKLFLYTTKNKIMENPAILIESLFEKAETFSKTTLELTKLKALKASTLITTSLVSRISVIIMFASFGLVFTLGIALWLGELLGKPYYGFFIVAAFYLIAGILFHFFLYKWIRKPISNSIIKQVF